MPKRQAPGFFCKQCGHETSRWEGKCPACQEWGSLVEAPVEKAKPSGRRGRETSASRLTLTGSSELKPLREHARDTLPRLAVPIGEIHRVLGGGIVPGGSVLVGGEPGIGKSTLLLQLLAALAAGESVRSGQGESRREGEAESAKEQRKPCFIYITGEEAPSQIAARGLRLAANSSTPGHSPRQGGGKQGYDSERLKLASETDLARILAMLEAERPQVAVIDSIQTVRDEGLDSAAGSISQVRECAMALVDAGRQLNTAVFLIGHVTKDGVIAGPRVLEHIVDTVLSFEGEMRLDLRVLRASHHRGGCGQPEPFSLHTDASLTHLVAPAILSPVGLFRAEHTG
ncbi:MAG: AAA family ATPase, partial [Planctomycetota bacterium]